MTKPPPAGMSFGSLFIEAGNGLTGHPLRSALTALGIAVGLAALVASIGISQSAGGQIVATFHEAQASHLTATAAESADVTIQDDSIEELRNRPGVTGADAVAVHENVLARTRAPEHNPVSTEITSSLIGAEPRFFDTTSAVFSAGRPFDAGHLHRHAPVAVLGVGAARRLGIDTIAGQPVVFISGRQVLVIGILERTAFFTQAADAIITPQTTATDVVGDGQRTTVLVTTQKGNTYTIARDLPFVLHPHRPEDITVAVPPPPPNVVEAVSSDLDTLALTLAGVGALVAAISVTAIMTITVVERTAEIGLRRAFGASRRGIAAQFLVESLTIGTIGGITGSILGVVFVLAAAELRNWIAVLSGPVPYLAAILGVTIGLVAGTYPAIRAANIAPTASLRG